MGMEVREGEGKKGRHNHSSLFWPKAALSPSQLWIGQSFMWPLKNGLSTGEDELTFKPNSATN